MQAAAGVAHHSRRGVTRGFLPTRERRGICVTARTAGRRKLATVWRDVSALGTPIWAIVKPSLAAPCPPASSCLCRGAGCSGAHAGALFAPLERRTLPLLAHAGSRSSAPKREVDETTSSWSFGDRAAGAASCSSVPGCSFTGTARRGAVDGQTRRELNDVPCRASEWPVRVISA